MSGRPRVDLGAAAEAFRADLLEGLRGSPKRIPCKYLYDREGSRLFDEITRLEEYYLTRAEVAILEEHAREMAALLGPRCLLVEPGSGSSVKTEILLRELDSPAAYVPVDISREHLLATVDRLRADHPGLEVIPVVADYTAPVRLPEPRVRPRRRAIFFPGSTIGNFDPGEAVEFLARLAALAGPGGALLIGVDVPKDRRTLERAYDDRSGVTAAFNRNLLERANRELGTDFRPERFEHRAVWNEARRRVEMHLVSRARQVVHVAGETIPLEAGESIWTESSYKYAPLEFAGLAEEAGLEPVRVWTDEARRFSVHYDRVAAGEAARGTGRPAVTARARSGGRG